MQLPARPPSDAIVLFDGQNLAEWRSEEHGPARWEVRDGAMVSVPGSGYIYSQRVFGDVQLHVEWAAPMPARGHGQERGNSGVFLMSKYEIQVLDSYQDETYADGQAASVYGQYPPLVNACLPPGAVAGVRHRVPPPAFSPRWRAGVASAGHGDPQRNSGSRQCRVVGTDELVAASCRTQRMRISCRWPCRTMATRFGTGTFGYASCQSGRSRARGRSNKKETIELSPDVLQRYVGTYQTTDDEQYTITLDGNQLRPTSFRPQRIELVPHSTTEFSLRWTAARFVFELDEDGRPSGGHVSCRREHAACAAG